jgi:hypothetical protein
VTVQLTETVTVAEAIWVLAALVGVAVNTWALLDAIQDRCALLRSGRNGALGIISIGNVRREALRVCIQGAFLIVGLVSLTQQPSARPSGEPGILSLVVPPVLIGVALTLVVMAVLDRADRYRVLGLLRVQRGEERRKRQTYPHPGRRATDHTEGHGG